MSFKQQLIDLDVCKEAIDWVEDRTIQQAWKDCPHGDWMLWLLEEMEGEKGWLDEKEIMLLGCWCARRVLKYIPEGETRPLKAIEAKEAWARGEITREEMAVALTSVWTAVHDAVIVARNAACNVTCTAACAAALAAANAVASDTAWVSVWISAYDKRSGTGWTAAYDEESLIQANYIRTQFTPLKGNL